jgi:hypothetical protein
MSPIAVPRDRRAAGHRPWQRAAVERISLGDQDEHAGTSPRCRSSHRSFGLIVAQREFARQLVGERIVGVDGSKRMTLFSSTPC